MKITIFSEELRKCLNAAGLSDCGENDTWNYWYQRLMSAYNESVERQIMTEQAENAKLRELVRNLYAEWVFAHRRMRYIVLQHEERMRGIEQCMRELGVEP